MPAWPLNVVAVDGERISATGAVHPLVPPVGRLALRQDSRWNTLWPRSERRCFPRLWAFFVIPWWHACLDPPS